MGKRRRPNMYKFLLISSIFLIVVGILLTAFSVFSPLWEIVDIPRSHLSHHHGLWWDCIVHHDTLIPLDPTDKKRENTCNSKLEDAVQANVKIALEYGDDEGKELLLHRFLPHHKGVIFFAVFTMVFGLISIVIGVCSPCFPPNSLLYVVGVFMTSACSLLADVTFLCAFNQNQLVVSESKQPVTLQLEPTRRNYPIFKRLGIATYIHMFSTLCFIASFLFSMFCAYFLITSQKSHDSCCTSRKEYRETARFRNNGLILKTGGSGTNNLTSRPFVVIDDDSSSM